MASTHVPVITAVRGEVMMVRTMTDILQSLSTPHREEHPQKKEESVMRSITVGITLAILVLGAALYLPTQHAGAQQPEKFDLEKAITSAKTPADHEAIAAYYDKESTTAKAKA